MNNNNHLHELSEDGKTCKHCGATYAGTHQIELKPIPQQPEQQETNMVISGGLKPVDEVGGKGLQFHELKEQQAEQFKRLNPEVE